MMTSIRNSRRLVILAGVGGVLAAGIALGGLVQLSRSPDAAIDAAGLGAPPSVAELIPPPASLDELLNGAELVALVTIGDVVKESREGPYGAPYPVDPDPQVPQLRLFPFTYYSVLIEDVVFSSRGVNDGDRVVMRVNGVASSEVAFSGRMLMPRPGDRRLFISSLQPDGTYGAASFSLLALDGPVVRFVDKDLTTPEFLADRTSPEDVLSDVERRLN